jgi:hypothetical protein
MVDVLPTLSSILEVVKVRGIEDCLYEAALRDDHYRAGLPSAMSLAVLYFAGEGRERARLAALA